MARYIKTEDAIPYSTKYIPSVEAVEREKIAKAIEEIRDLPFASSKTKVVDGVKAKGEWIETIYRDDVLEILERCLSE